MDLDREHYINSVNLNIDTDFPYLVLNVVGGNAFPRNTGTEGKYRPASYAKNPPLHRKTLCGRYYIGRSGHERQYQQIGMFPLFQTEYEYHTL